MKASRGHPPPRVQGGFELRKDPFMKRDVILPRFNLPGQTSWLMKGLWVAVAVVLVQVAVLVTTLLVRQRIDDGRAPAAVLPGNAPIVEAPPPETLSVAAEAPPETPTAPPAMEARWPKVRAGGPVPGMRAKLNRPGGRGKNGLSRFDRARGKARRNGDPMFARTSLAPRKAAGAKLAAGGRVAPRKGGGRNVGRTSKPDAIDQLLRSFK
jgi:hypothetical protein